MQYIQEIKAAIFNSLGGKSGNDLQFRLANDQKEVGRAFTNICKILLPIIPFASSIRKAQTMGQTFNLLKLFVGVALYGNFGIIIQILATFSLRAAESQKEKEKFNFKKESAVALGHLLIKTGQFWIETVLSAIVTIYFSNICSGINYSNSSVIEAVIISIILISATLIGRGKLILRKFKSNDNETTAEMLWAFGLQLLQNPSAYNVTKAITVIIWTLGIILKKISGSDNDCNY